ncbi:MAG: rod-binding protein [Desulfotalea sp.]
MDFKLDMRTQISASKLSPIDKKSRDLEKLKNACQEFEAIYVNQMLKEARKTVPEDGLFQKDSATKMYEEMIDMERARQVSKGPGLGIATAMYEQMSHLIENKK